VSFLRLRTLRAQALLILAVLILLVVLGASRVVTHQVASSDASAAADRNRQIELDAAALLTGMLNEETGVRGFSNTGQQQFLEPYHLGRTQVTQAEDRLNAEAGRDLGPQLHRVQDAASAWQAWADARVAAVTAAGGPVIDEAQSARGKSFFDPFRTAIQDLNTQVAADLSSAQTQARREASSVTAATIATGVLVIAILVLLGLVVYRSVLRPLGALFQAASSLAAGERTEIPELRSDNEVGRLAGALASWKRTELERLSLLRTANELSSRVELDEILELGAERLREVLNCPSSPSASPTHRACAQYFALNRRRPCRPWRFRMGQPVAKHSAPGRR
jgi:CHASE3 domain sensor protein